MSRDLARRVGALGLAMVICLLSSVEWQTSTYAQSTGGPSSFGFAATGTCRVGECPPTQPLGEADVSILIDFTFSLANGDQFRIVGSQNQANHNTCVTAFSARRQWSIQYVGNSKGNPSQSDTLNLEVWISWLCNLRNARANWDIGGSFGPGIAPGSSLLAIFDRGATS